MLYIGALAIIVVAMLVGARLQKQQDAADLDYMRTCVDFLRATVDERTLRNAELNRKLVDAEAEATYYASRTVYHRMARNKMTNWWNAELKAKREAEARVVELEKQLTHVQTVSQARKTQLYAMAYGVPSKCFACRVASSS